MDYCNVLFSNAPLQLVSRLQKGQNAAASFVKGKYCKVNDVLNFNWLPIRGRIDHAMLKLAFKRVHEKSLPSYLHLQQKVTLQSLRNKDQLLLHIPKDTNTFEGKTSRLFNELPKNIREESNKQKFNKLCQSFLFDRELSRNLTV